METNRVLSWHGVVQWHHLLGGLGKCVFQARHHQELYSWPQNPHTRTSRSWSVGKISKPHPYHSLRAHSIKWYKDPLAIKLAISEQLGYATEYTWERHYHIITLATPVDFDSSLSQSESLSPWLWLALHY